MGTEEPQKKGGCFLKQKLTNVLSKSYIGTNIILFIFSFIAYFACYAFRKPFSVYTYEGYSIWGVDFKIMIVTLQVIGYTLSKFIGISFISTIDMAKRGYWIVGLIFLAEVTLILFRFIPVPYNALMMFLNGLPLGVMWGLVYSYLEGRKWSEVLGAGLCVSFIVSSGFVKSVGQAILNTGVNPFWMPAIVGAIFFPILAFSVFMLESCPGPTREDIELRTERIQMSAHERWVFIKFFMPGLIVMIIYFMLLTGFRDFRDNFAPELWAALGYKKAPSIFSIAEVIVAIIVVIPIGCLLLIKDNMKGLMGYHVMIIITSIIFAILTYIFRIGKLNGTVWMICTGFGCYLPYVPFNSIIFDRVIAAFEYKANVGFVMFVADSLGYLTAVLVMLYKNFGAKNLDWLSFFESASFILAGVGVVLMTISAFYYWFKYKKHPKIPGNEPLLSQMSTNS